MLRLVVFDFDGVIADSEPAHYEIFRQVLAEDNLDIDWQRYCERYLGYSDIEAFRHILADLNENHSDERIAELCQRKKAAFADYIREQNIILPGVRELLADLKANDIICAICSGALRSEIQLIAELGGLLDYFSVIVAAEDVQRGKPHPQGFEMARLRVNETLQSDQPITPSQTAAIEDSLWGIQAAQGAGYKCLGVASTYDKNQLTNADAVVETLEEASADFLNQMLN